MLTMVERLLNMFKKINILNFIFLCSVVGCSNTIDKTISPPENSKLVSVKIKNPSIYTKPFPLAVRYISQECKKRRISGFDGSVIIEPSYNVIQATLKQKDNDIWIAQIATIGGGKCRWMLSAITLGIEYSDAIHLRKDLTLGSAAGMIIAFDNDASRNGQYSTIKGDINVSPKYYPYIREKKIDKIENTLSLLGKESFITLRAIESWNIVFSPKLDENKIVIFEGIEKKEKGVYPKIIYPDGTIAPPKTLFPDFDKVDKMKL